MKSKLSGDKILSEIREDIKEKVQQKFYFYDTDDVMIDEKDENETILNEILDEKNNTINIKSLVPNIKIGKPTSLNIKPDNKPMENAKYIKNLGNLKIYQYPDIKFTVNEEATCQIVLVVGQTGSGKTTFINAYLNYLMGIDLDDEFRYFLIVEDDKQRKSASQTKGLHIYNIRSKNMTIKIVDTQGYGDTEGPKEDENITNTIKDAFNSELNSINTICFIVKSSDSRLTSSQKYIFSSIISLFGQDIKSNFLALLTFYDGNKPAAIETLKTSDFNEIIPCIKEPWYLTFNSNLLFTDENDENYEELLIKAGWETAKKNYKILNDKILSLGRQSLTQSKENLNLREKIQINIDALQALLTKEVDFLYQLESQKNYIQEHEKEINTKKITKIPKVVKKEEKKRTRF
jgi:GTP-binding protein EngB required for normal cell division